MTYVKTNWEQGKTPINATNLNKIEEGIANAVATDSEARVLNVVSKNLFNYKNAIYYNAYLDTSKGTWEAFSTSGVYASTYIKVEPNTTYTISKKVGGAFRIATFIDLPQVGNTYNKTYANHTGTEITFTTEANDNYLVILCFSTANGDTGTYLEMYSTVQLELGDKATSYVPYLNLEEAMLKTGSTTNITMVSGYSLNNSGTSQSPIIEKQGKIVHLAMNVTKDGDDYLPTDETKIAQLPAGFRPKYTQIFTCGISENVWMMRECARLMIDTSGNVFIRNNSGNQRKYAFINVTFFTD